MPIDILRSLIVKPFFLFCSLIFLSLSQIYAQSGKKLPLRLQQHKVEELRITEKDQKTFQCDASAMVADENRFHMLFTEGRKLYYAISGNRGKTWETELVAYLSNEENIDPRLHIKVGDRGTVHLFYPEQKATKTQIWHYSRPQYSLGWAKKLVYEAEHEAGSKFDMDVDLDCNNKIFMVYNVGDGAIHYAYSENQTWQYQKLPYGNRAAGCAIISGFDQNVYIAIARDQGDLILASKKVREEKWNTEKITGPVYGDCDITLVSDGGLLVVSSPVVSGLDKPYQLSLKKADEGWVTHSLEDPEGYNLSRGKLKKIEAKTDPSGRIHLAHYFTNYSAPNNKSLAHLYSNDRGQSWQAEIMSENINGYISRFMPSLVWSHNYIYIACKNPDYNPIINILHSDRNLKEFPRCLYRRNPLHDDVVYVRDTVSRIVDVPVREPDPIPIHSPIIRSNPDDRITNTQGSFITKDSTIKVILKDYQDVDGDTVSVFLGDNCILYRYALTSRPLILSVDIVPKKELTMRIFAESEGTKPPCTVAFSLRDSKRTQRYVIKSNLNSNGAIILNPKR